MDFELILREGEEPGSTFIIRQGELVTIGRSPECEICLDDLGVSRRHCSIENRDQELLVKDLKSANGTFINDTLVESGTLNSGDQITVGKKTFECQVKQPERPLIQGKVKHGETALSFRDEGNTTLLRKVIDTSTPKFIQEGIPRLEQIEDLQKAQRNLATAYQISKLMVMARDLNNLYEGIIESIFHAVDADRVALLLQGDVKSSELKVVAARTRQSGEKLVEISVSRTVIQDVLENSVSTLSWDALADARYREGESIIQQNIRSVICVPLSTDERIIGVIYADSPSIAGAFTESDLELLALIGNQAGVAIHRAQLIAQLERFFLDTIRAMVATIDAKDGYTHRHSERVAAFAMSIGREVGRSEDELKQVQLAALLHDVGKIGISEKILNKPTKLTDKEYEEIKKHAVHGFEILSHIKNPIFEAILPGVKHHHERWDGSGYPDGLTEQDIPWIGRLLAVADVLDALNSDRSYRKGIPIDEVVNMIVDGGGKHFDPELTQAVRSLHDRGELVLSNEWVEPKTGSESKSSEDH
jgi:HD-GYP domain-containing protein (c-di-GMP phosphodiesterase class II)